MKTIKICDVSSASTYHLKQRAGQTNLRLVKRASKNGSTGEDFEALILHEFKAERENTKTFVSPDLSEDLTNQAISILQAFWV